MPSSMMLAVQDAILVALEADVGFTWPVFDHIPESQLPPYVRVGEATEMPDNTQDGYGWEQTVTVHVFSQHKGFAEAKTIASELCRVLDHQILPVAGGSMWRLTYDNSWTLEESTSAGVITRHIPVQFRVGVKA